VTSRRSGSGRPTRSVSGSCTKAWARAGLDEVVRGAPGTMERHFAQKGRVANPRPTAQKGRSRGAHFAETGSGPVVLDHANHGPGSRPTAHVDVVTDRLTDLALGGNIADRVRWAERAADMSLNPLDQRLLRVSKSKKSDLGNFKEGVHLEAASGRSIDDLHAQACADRLGLARGSCSTLIG